MFKSILLVAFAFVAFAGAAEARPDTRKMTCRQAADFVRENGPVVMTYGYGRGGPLYSKFQSWQCGGRPGDGNGGPAWVPTLDSSSCYIGYACNN